MGIDSNSLLTSLGVFSATVGAISVYANIASYYGTKYKLNSLKKRYGQQYAEDVFKRECDAYKSPTTNLFGGIGIKLLKKSFKF